MHTPVFSIIIPMYNVSEYLVRCIESLEQQDVLHSDYEIICINDGSPDNCKEIIKELQLKYSNIILIDQKNQGVSIARNNGIAIAKGTYILPIDPDDYVVRNSFKRIFSLIEKNKYDVLYLGYEYFDANGNSIWRTNYKKQNHLLFDGVEGYFESRGNEVKDPDRSVAILYKKELLDKYSIVYPENVPYLEDGLFLAKVFAVANNVSFDDTIFYQRTTREGSATNSKLFYSEKAIDGFIIAIKALKEFEKQNELMPEQHKLINHVIAKFVILSVSPSASQVNFNAYFTILKKLKKAKTNRLEIEGLRFVYKRHIKMFNFSKILFPIYFKIFNKYKK